MNRVNGCLSFPMYTERKLSVCTERCERSDLCAVAINRLFGVVEALEAAANGALKTTTL